MKKCYKCNETKTLPEFYRHKGMTDGHLNICRVCTISKSAVNQKKNPDKTRKDKRDLKRKHSEQYYRVRLLKEYNLTPEAYTELLLKQACACAVCFVPTSELTYKLYVDHDHVTGKVRGLLCQKCNSGIGMLQDTLTVVESAVEYLKRAA